MLQYGGSVALHALITSWATNQRAEARITFVIILKRAITINAHHNLRKIIAMTPSQVYDLSLIT